MLKLKHPQHGFHLAYSNAEADAMRKSGWTLDAPEPDAPAKAEEVTPESTEPVQEHARRPGRPRKQ